MREGQSLSGETPSSRLGAKFVTNSPRHRSQLQGDPKVFLSVRHVGVTFTQRQVGYKPLGSQY